jgi:hypothetical protein
MGFHLLAFLYGGPDQLMPLTSGLAVVFAFLLIFWNKVLVRLGKLLTFLKRGSGSTTAFREPPKEKD